MSESKVFITGASSGIGAAIAEVYASSFKNAKIGVCARRKERLEELKKKLEASGATCWIYSTDVTDETSVKTAIEEFAKSAGGIDVVYANAGFGVTERFENLTNEDYRKQFETNIFGVLNTLRHSLPFLKFSKGKVALIGSVSSYVCTQADSPYSMSKAAVRSLADTLYLENVGSGVSVSFVAPGFVTSEIRHKNNNEVYDPDSEDRAPAWAVMDTATAAKQIVRGVEARKREIVITAFGKFICWLRRISPSTCFRLLKAMSKMIDRKRSR